MLTKNFFDCTFYFWNCPAATESSTKGEVPRSRGVMTITNLELGNLIPDSKAWIEYMGFEANVYLPTE